MSTEKIDLHYHQQLSALVDGELAPDQARFLLRRLQHDEELAACVGRWQMLGDVLRGNAIAPAPEGFSARLAAAVAAELPVTGMSQKARHGRRALWGGGAIAASVAAVAFFIAVPQVPEAADPLQSPAVATQAAASDPGSPGTAKAPDARASAPAPRDDLARRIATRSGQAGRSAAIAAQAPERAVANAPLPVVHSIASAPADTAGANPFANVRLDPPAARPWPRTVLPRYSSAAFNAEYPVDRTSLAFYPFEPSLPPALPLTPPLNAPGEDQ